MKRAAILMSFVLTGLAIPALMSGCDREVSHTKTVEKEDGKVKTKEKTVTQNPDGSVTTTEERKETKP
jgi:hypothetical protein